MIFTHQSSWRTNRCVLQIQLSLQQHSSEFVNQIVDIDQISVLNRISGFHLYFTSLKIRWKSSWNNRCQSAHIVMLFVFNQPRFAAHSEWNVGGCRTNAEKFVENLNSENQLLNFELDVCDAMSSFLAN